MSAQYEIGFIPEVTLGQRIRIAREFANLEQIELAHVTGIARTTISRYELGGTKRIGGLYMAAIALATGVNRHWLETGCEPDGDDPLVHREGLEPPTR